MVNVSFRGRSIFPLTHTQVAPLLLFPFYNFTFSGVGDREIAG